MAPPDASEASTEEESAGGGRLAALAGGGAAPGDRQSSCYIQDTTDTQRFLIKVHADGYTEFIRDSGGNRRYLVLQPAQRDKTLETLVHLVSQPPAR